MGVRVAVVGDSLSAGFAPAFTAEAIGPTSYLHYALGEDAVLAGGTAVPGATSVEQRERAAPVDADILILALGTNDLAWGIPFDDTAAALLEIRRIVGAPRVMLLSIPPIEPELGPTTSVYNRQLRRLAAAEGWDFVDAAESVRDGDGWAPGMTTDGVHYTVAGARAVGSRLATFLRSGL